MSNNISNNIFTTGVITAGIFGVKDKDIANSPFVFWAVYVIIVILAAFLGSFLLEWAQDRTYKWYRSFKDRNRYKVDGRGTT